MTRLRARLANQRGLTLLETLIGIGIMTMALTMVAMPLVAALRQDGDWRADITATTTLQRTAGWIGRDLALSQVLVERDYDPTPPFTSGNPAKLKQALMTLILNAKDAMPNGGTVTLGTKFDNGRVLIWCTDTGRGIDPQDMHYMFDAFYTTKDHGLGAGLGLHVATPSWTSTRGTSPLTANLATAPPSPSISPRSAYTPCR